MSELEVKTYPPFMTKANARKWVNALRSGKYVQGKYLLKDVTFKTYCCVGVLCEAVANEKPFCSDHTETGWIDPDSHPKTCNILGTVDKFFGFNISNVNDYNHLDSEGFTVSDSLTFDEIADLIQLQNIEGAGV